jgi:hypothetical protein
VVSFLRNTHVLIYNFTAISFYFITKDQRVVNGKQWYISTANIHSWQLFFHATRKDFDQKAEKTNGGVTDVMQLRQLRDNMRWSGDSALLAIVLAAQIESNKSGVKIPRPRF